MVGGAWMWFPDEGRSSFEQRLKAAGTTRRTFEQWAIAAYPELPPREAIKKYLRGLGQRHDDAFSLGKNERVIDAMTGKPF